jgi:hypothetical protein
MRIFKCDHCGKQESPKEGEEFVENWDTVTISTSFCYDVCEKCAKELFEFLKAI